MYPSAFNASREIFQQNNHCAAMSVWMVLDQMQLEVDPKVILDNLKITEEYGTFTIAIALLFYNLGLDTTFRTIEDLDKHKDELSLYEEAERKGLRIERPIEVSKFNNLLKSGKHLIVFYDEGSDNGHFSPVESVKSECIKLPLSNYGDLSIFDFQERRSRSGYLMQTVEIQKQI